MNGWIGLLLILCMVLAGAGAIAWSAGTRRREREKYVIDLRTIDEWERRRQALRVIHSKDAGVVNVGHAIGASLAVAVVLAVMALGGALTGVAQ